VGWTWAANPKSSDQICSPSDRANWHLLCLKLPSAKNPYSFKNSILCVWFRKIEKVSLKNVQLHFSTIAKKLCVLCVKDHQASENNFLKVSLSLARSIRTFAREREIVQCNNYMKWTALKCISSEYFLLI
jgi:hypothetical protein